jgi:transposase-like protein
VSDLTLAIPRLSKGSFFPRCPEPRRRVDQALDAVVMEAYTGGMSTWKIVVLGGTSSICKYVVSRIC